MLFEILTDNLRQMLAEVIESKTEAERFGQALFIRTVVSGKKLHSFTQSFLSSPCGDGWDKKKVFASVGYSKAHGYKLLKIGEAQERAADYITATEGVGVTPTVDGFIRWIKTGAVTAAAAADATTDTDATDATTDATTDVPADTDTTNDTDARPGGPVLIVKFDTRPLGGDLNVTFSVDASGNVTGTLPADVLTAIREILADVTPAGQSHE